jgi:hypothetical protein
VSAGREIERGLLLNGAVRAVAVRRVGSTEKQSVSCLISLQIKNPKNLTPLNFMNPPIASRNNVPVNRSFGCKFAFRHIT